MAAVAPGAFLVDSIPLLKYVPSWMPGAGFKRKAEEWNSWAKNMMEIPFMAAQSAIVSCRNCAMKLNTGISHPIQAGGTAKPSFVSLCLAGLDETSDVDHQLKVIWDTAGTFFVGECDVDMNTMGILYQKVRLLLEMHGIVYSQTSRFSPNFSTSKAMTQQR